MMDNIKKMQNDFFEMLKSIQEVAVFQALSEYDKKDSLEDLLYNATYEAMVSICELFDGYTSEDIQLDLIEKNSNMSLTTGIQMHDMCADYLKCES